MIELDVVGVRVEVSTSTPMLLLKESHGQRYLSIWVGSAEAASIVNALESTVAPRPSTHELISAILSRMAANDLEGHIVEVDDGVFYAKLIVGDQVFDCRPSDLVAIALRCGFKVMCARQVIEQVGVTIFEKGEDEVERFKQFLDHISPEDFE